MLVYYSPAFVRQLTPSHAKDALRLLAEVYRRARSLWPLRPEDELGLENGETVTVRIDQIKELNLFDIQSIYAGGESWCLSKRNAKEGVIERQPLDVLAKSLQKDTYKVLKFWRVTNETKTSDDFYKNSMQRHVMHAVGRAVQQHMQVRAVALHSPDHVAARALGRRELCVPPIVALCTQCALRGAALGALSHLAADTRISSLAAKNAVVRARSCKQGQEQKSQPTQHGCIAEGLVNRSLQQLTARVGGAARAALRTEVPLATRS